MTPPKHPRPENESNGEYLRDKDDEAEENKQLIIDALPTACRHTVEKVRKQMMSLFARVPEICSRKQAKKKARELAQTDYEPDLPQQAMSPPIDHDAATPAMDGKPVIPGVQNAPPLQQNRKRRGSRSLRSR